MSIRSWLQRRKAGKSRSAVKAEAVRKNLPSPRSYNTATPAGLLESLDDDDRKALRSLFNATIGASVPFNNVRRLSDGSIVPCDINHPDVILSNVNSMGLLPCNQISNAQKKLGRLGLPDEVVPAAERFLEDFITKGMDRQPSLTFPDPEEGK